MNAETKKRKIGILTFHRARSYGAVLQCYALCQILRKIFPDAETGVIDFSPSRFSASKDCGKQKQAEVLLKFLLSNVNVVTPESDTLNECLSAGVTDILVGSDQVWNPGILKENLRDYFLCDIPENINKYSYAASFGSAEFVLPSEVDRVIRSALADFKNISVREGSAVGLCEKFGRSDAIRVLDPTLHAGRSEFDHIADTGTLTAPVVGYFLSPTPLQIKVLKKIAHDKRLKSSSILVLNRKAPFFSFIKSSVNTGVPDFLHAIKNAGYVVTDSFHGVCFAILFEKEFVVLPSRRKERFTRIAELLEILGLSARVMHTAQANDVRNILNNPIDFNEVRQKLSLLRDFSGDFLKNLRSSENDGN
ncbi:MAG: polysaccharide pyruvyl transferase family protein [Lentisphaeria bacterium]|nr:polysaccharide pyruvyl transferase family protein [Lentisphaeria bacterium]